MAWERGERGYRENFGRGRGPSRDLDEERDERYDRSGDYEDDEGRYGRPPEQRRWGSSEYDPPRQIDRGRSGDRYSEDAERLLDRRHRHGFLRGEGHGRSEFQEDDWRGAHRRYGAADRGPTAEQDRWTGPYAGRGPKNYRRSDERILEDVCERLMEHPSIDASEVEVSVQDGDVTLSGVVESRAVKHLTEAMAETVTGVKEVHNQLRIAPGESGSAASLPDEAVYRRRR